MTCSFFLKIAIKATDASLSDFRLFFCCLPPGSLQGEHQRRLYKELMANYNRLERPVVNDSAAILVELGLTLLQIIDVVRETLFPETLILGQFVVLSKVLSQLANVCVIGYSKKKAFSIRAVHVHPFSCFGIKCSLQCVLLTLTADSPL